MNDALRWQLYVCAYTLLFGLPLLLAPDLALPLMGFAPEPGPWTHLAGMFLLTLSALSFGIFRTRAIALIPFSIGVRMFIVSVLAALAYAGHPPILYAMAGIVLVGVLGSILACRGERRGAATAPGAAGRVGPR